MKLFGAIVLLGIAGFMSVGLLASDMAGGVGTTIFTALLVIGIPGAWGGLLLRSHLKGAPTLTAGRAELRRLTQSSEIMKLAERKGGRLTVVEVVAETALPAEAAEEMLGDFVRQGLAEPEVTDKGLVVYVFGDVEQLRDKGGSRGILET